MTAQHNRIFFFLRQFNRFIDQRKQFAVLFIDLVDARQTILRKFVHYYVPPSVYFLCENKSSFLPKEARTPQTVKNILAHLSDYAANHFAHEEAYMQAQNDP